MVIDERFCKEEAVPITLYDALWWTDQRAKPDPMTERDGTRPSVDRKLELCVGSANVRTLSPATDEPEVHSVRRKLLADAFSIKHIDVVGLQETRARNSTFRASGGFHMVTSAAVFGQGGVEIWIRQRSCDSKDLFFALPLSCFVRPMGAVSLKFYEKKQARWNGGRSLVTW